MTSLGHSIISTAVTRTSPGLIAARTHLIATGWEAAATLTAATATLAIEDAAWTVARSPGGAADGERAVPALRGVLARIGSGADLRAAARDEGDIPYRLIAECVKGIIQAETYLFRERGFPDAETYEQYWKDTYTGSCRLYSNLDRVVATWYGHISARRWSDLLFTRAKTAAVTAGGDGDLTIAGSFADSFHELGVTLTAQGGVITAVAGNFLRAPDPVCPETAAHLAALPGIPLAAGKTAVQSLGGPQGCVHLADLVEHLLWTAATLPYAP